MHKTYSDRIAEIEDNVDKIIIDAYTKLVEDNDDVDNINEVKFKNATCIVNGLYVRFHNIIKWYEGPNMDEVYGLKGWIVYGKQYKKFKLSKIPLAFKAKLADELLVQADLPKISVLV